MKDTVECDYCGKEKEKYISQINQDGNNFCNSECQGDYMSENQNGKNHPNWKKNKGIICETCGDKTYSDYAKHFCSRECYGEWKSKNVVGENHPNWKGGATGYYGENWIEMRNKTRERDDYKCVMCGKGEDEIGRMPSVHHIKPIGEFDEPEDSNYLDNLVSLCIKHHNMLEKLDADEQKDMLP